MVTVIGLDDASIVTPINDLQKNIDDVTRKTTGDINGNIMLMAVLFGAYGTGIR